MPFFSKNPSTITFPRTALGGLLGVYLEMKATSKNTGNIVKLRSSAEYLIAVNGKCRVTNVTLFNETSKCAYDRGQPKM